MSYKREMVNFYFLKTEALRSESVKYECSFFSAIAMNIGVFICCRTIKSKDGNNGSSSSLPTSNELQNQRTSRETTLPNTRRPSPNTLRIQLITDHSPSFSQRSEQRQTNNRSQNNNPRDSYSEIIDYTLPQSRYVSEPSAPSLINDTYDTSRTHTSPLHLSIIANHDSQRTSDTNSISPCECFPPQASSNNHSDYSSPPPSYESLQKDCFSVAMNNNK